MGAPSALRATLAPGQDPAGAVHDYGPLLNAAGQALLFTATYGAYRDDTAPCPAPWQAIIRWAGHNRAHLWTAKAAPPVAGAPTSRGFVIPAAQCFGQQDLSRKDTTDWYVDSRGRIGELRPIFGYPPTGIRAGAPLNWDGAPVKTRLEGPRRSLLADRRSDRVWMVATPRGLPDESSESAPSVLAQDVTGRLWVSYFGRHVDEQTYAPSVHFAWSDDHGATWETAPSGYGQLVYTDTTIGYLDTVANPAPGTPGLAKVSTDRGKTWQEHPVPDLRAVALPGEPLLRRWSVEEPIFATSSGTLLAVVSYSPNFVRYKPKPSVLVRSTDANWSHFEKVGELPAGYRWFVKDNTLSVCDEARCSYSQDLGATWHRIALPD